MAGTWWNLLLNIAQCSFSGPSSMSGAPWQQQQQQQGASVRPLMGISVVPPWQLQGSSSTAQPASQTGYQYSGNTPNLSSFYSLSMPPPPPPSWDHRHLATVVLRGSFVVVDAEIFQINLFRHGVSGVKSLGCKLLNCEVTNRSIRF